MAARGGPGPGYDARPGLDWYMGGDWLDPGQDHEEDPARPPVWQGSGFRGFALVTGVRVSF